MNAIARIEPAEQHFNVSDMERMANAIAKSQLFGVKSTEHVLALMLIAQAEGRHPATVARDYDIIQNRPAKKAEAMLRDFIACGGKVEWHALDDTKADATFSHPQGGTLRIDWDIKRAAAAGLTGKQTWKQYPRAMLRSRVVSEGVRAVCPSATSGMYVPEEVRDFAPDDRPAFEPEKAAAVVDPEPPSDIEQLAAEFLKSMRLFDPTWAEKDVAAAVKSLKARAAKRKEKFCEAYIVAAIDELNDKLAEREASAPAEPEREYVDGQEVF